MTQAYSDPSREDDAFALPDIEVFWMSAHDYVTGDSGEELRRDFASFHDVELDDLNDEGISAIIGQQNIKDGWYYWYCFPGCLPDSDPYGPYATEAEALEAAQDDAAEF